MEVGSAGGVRGIMVGVGETSSGVKYWTDGNIVKMHYV